MVPNASDNLAQYEVPRALLEPLLPTFRLTNAACDLLFYDVNAFTMKLMIRNGDGVGGGSASSAPPPGGREALQHFDFDAVTNPEGTILIIDATTAPHVSRYHDMRVFLNAVSADLSGTLAKVQTVTVTGVGSSALGSAAFDWNVSAAVGGALGPHLRLCGCPGAGRVAL